jgi:hypothetical protein
MIIGTLGWYCHWLLFKALPRTLNFNFNNNLHTHYNQQSRPSRYYPLAHSHDIRQNNELTTDMVTVHINHHNRFFLLPLLSFTSEIHSGPAIKWPTLGPSQPSDVQLQELAKLNEWARRRACDCELIQQEVAWKEATTVTRLYYHWLYPDRLEGMEQEEGKSQQLSQSTGTVQNEPRTASQAQKRPHDQSVSSESGNKPRTTYYRYSQLEEEQRGTSAGILDTPG